MIDDQLDHELNWWDRRMEEYLEYEKTFPVDATLAERNKLIREYFDSLKQI